MNLFVRDTKYSFPFWGIKIISSPHYPIIQNLQFTFRRGGFYWRLWIIWGNISKHWLYVLDEATYIKTTISVRFFNRKIALWTIAESRDTTNGLIREFIYLLTHNWLYLFVPPVCVVPHLYRCTMGTQRVLNCLHERSCKIMNVCLGRNYCMGPE